MNEKQTVEYWLPKVRANRRTYYTLGEHAKKHFRADTKRLYKEFRNAKLDEQQLTLIQQIYSVRTFHGNIYWKRRIIWLILYGYCEKDWKREFWDITDKYGNK